MATPVIVNGFASEFNAIEIVLNGTTYLDFKGIDYSTETDGGDVKGTAPEAIARTLGNISHTGNFEMYDAAAAQFLAQLGPNYLAIPFDITVHKANADGSSIVTDTLRACLIKKVSDSHKQGSDALSRTFDLRPFRIPRGTANNLSLAAIVTDILDPFAT